MMGMIVSLGMLALGFFLLVKGADWFVDGVSGIADRFGIPQLVIGLTVVAMGTSLPEAAVSITAALDGVSGIAMGNIVGSNILNILIILGITAVLTRVPVQRSTVRVEIPYMILITVVLLVLGLSGRRISRGEGAVLWGFFLIYLGYLGYIARKGQEQQGDEPEIHRHLPVYRLLLMTALGVCGIIAGSKLAVGGASDLARAFGISEKFIGLTVVALGTSLPELVTSVIAARRGKADIAIGNIVGSNVFNILFVIGTTSLITPVPFPANFIPDMAVAIGAALLLWAGVLKKHALGRGVGVVMLLAYAGYFAYLCR